MYMYIFRCLLLWPLYSVLFPINGKNLTSVVVCLLFKDALLTYPVMKPYKSWLSGYHHKKNPDREVSHDTIEEIYL